MLSVRTSKRSGARSSTAQRGEGGKQLDEERRVCSSPRSDRRLVDRQIQMRMIVKLEDERQALAAFVKKFEPLGLGGPVFPVSSKLQPPLPAPEGAAQKNRTSTL